MDSIERIAEKTTLKTNGRIKFKVYGPELADWTELNEMVIRGDIDMMLCPLSPSYDPRWNATYTPYIVTTYEEAKEAFGRNGFMDKMFKEWAKDVNMHYLGTWLQGFSGVSLSKKAATTKEEAKGIKIRTPPIAAFECYWQALGFTPALIPYSEVPTAISTGIVDGQAGGGPFQTYSCCRDLNKYFVFYRDFVELWGYTVNLKQWNQIDESDQKIIKDIVIEEVEARIENAEKEDMEYMQKLRDHGLTVVDLADQPDKLKNARDTARTCWEKMDKIVGKEWMDEIREAVNVK
jgi:TRAP-type C4-dicarboxylate transport system substrate-binding protein